MSLPPITSPKKKYLRAAHDEGLNSSTSQRANNLAQKIFVTAHRNTKKLSPLFVPGFKTGLEEIKASFKESLSAENFEKKILNDSDLDVVVPPELSRDPEIEDLMTTYNSLRVSCDPIEEFGAVCGEELRNAAALNQKTNVEFLMPYNRIFNKDDPISIEKNRALALLDSIEYLDIFELILRDGDLPEGSPEIKEILEEIRSRARTFNNDQILRLLDP